MIDPIFTNATAVSMLALAITSLIALKGWRDWIALRRYELDHAAGRHAGEPHGTGDATMQRIEIADLRERLRKLEAIAAGVDL
ncbi:MAG: hypothetical protein HC774_02395 [Sphingomonadales bacterium]|nr:hypothetical protein [Sphingomonadales bacterium]